MKKLVVATKNKGKLVEIRRKLGPLKVDLLSLSDIAPELTIIEDGATFEANAIKKALAVSQITGLPALSDDSGLEVDALSGRPGVHSARYGGPGLNDSDRNRHLLDELNQAQSTNRSCRFRAALAYLVPPGDPKIFLGVLEGSIALEPSGDHGFGYDPIFIPEGRDQTLGVLGPDVKSRISHRARALDTFVAWLSDQTVV